MPGGGVGGEGKRRRVSRKAIGDRYSGSQAKNAHCEVAEENGGGRGWVVVGEGGTGILCVVVREGGGRGSSGPNEHREGRWTWGRGVG